MATQLIYNFLFYKFIEFESTFVIGDSRWHLAAKRFSFLVCILCIFLEFWYDFLNAAMFFTIYGLDPVF